jgi:hypothetical protein
MFQLITGILISLICLASGYYIGYSDGFRFGYSKCLEHNSKKVKKVFEK